jgi:hypothetical protein
MAKIKQKIEKDMQGIEDTYADNLFRDRQQTDQYLRVSQSVSPKKTKAEKEVIQATEKLGGKKLGTTITPAPSLGSFMIKHNKKK